MGFIVTNLRRKLRQVVKFYNGKMRLPEPMDRDFGAVWKAPEGLGTPGSALLKLPNMINSWKPLAVVVSGKS